jgi:hypothetical protein
MDSEGKGGGVRRPVRKGAPPPEMQTIPTKGRPRFSPNSYEHPAEGVEPASTPSILCPDSRGDRTQEGEGPPNPTGRDSLTELQSVTPP